jgi:pyruvate/2-oxoglutarate dehydrogenase complex dihydrolipoamide dehydrogenase (E3) component
MIIACGSRPALPKIPGINSSIVCSSDSLWDIKKLPKSLVIIGGGPIGCELASAYSQLGSKVTLIESNDHILQFLTKHQAEIAQNSLLENEVEILFNSSVSSIDDNSVTINASHKVKTDLVIVATGRSPNTEWLKDSGIELDGRGYIKVNKSLKTNLKSVYACGDVTGGYQFTHVAAYEAGYASSNAIFDWTKYTRKPKYNVIPWTIFTTPEVAQVGISAKNKKPDHVVTHLDLSEIDKAKTDSKAKGGIWLISDKKGCLLGATIISEQASSLIGEATLAINKKLTVKDIFSTIHVYPGYGEIYSRSAGKWQRSRVNKRLLSIVGKSFRLFR